MTAEIVIMNKSAIALAADSAVTIGYHDKKIYNTVNKLFSLSKYHPVGIMIYDSANIMDIPWETIIKEFRKYLNDGKRDTVSGYYDAFVEFIENENIIFDDRRQENYFYNIVSVYFLIIQEEIDDSIKKAASCGDGISEDQVKSITESIIDKHFKSLSEYDLLPGYDDDYVSQVIDKYKEVIVRAKDDVFEKRPLSKISVKKLSTMAGYITATNAFMLGTTGVVIAGFGDKELFPAVIDFKAEYLLNKKLKRYDVKNRKIDGTTNAQIMPFAQFEMPYRFMEGVDPFYSEVIKNSVREMFYCYSDVLIENFSKLGIRAQTRLKEKLKPITNSMLKDFGQQLTEYRRENYVSPVLQAVAALPKDELASMAESLVHITSLKRKFSMEQETVAGPIDVAIISKGDGFIWIKRKHYFNPELNQHFFTNYFR